MWRVWILFLNITQKNISSHVNPLSKPTPDVSSHMISLLLSTESASSLLPNANSTCKFGVQIWLPRTERRGQNKMWINRPICAGIARSCEKNKFSSSISGASYDFASLFLASLPFAKATSSPLIWLVFFNLGYWIPRGPHFNMILQGTPSFDGGSRWPSAVGDVILNFAQSWRIQRGFPFSRMFGARFMINICWREVFVMLKADSGENRHLIIM